MSAPDSEAWEGQTLKVRDTPDRDNPKYGSVTLEFQTGSNHSNLIRITRDLAENLNEQLTAYLKEK